MSFGTLHIDESVFAFILDPKSGQFLSTKDKQFTHHLVWCTSPFGGVSIRVWGIVYMVHGLSRASDQINEKCSTLSYTETGLGAGA